MRTLLIEDDLMIGRGLTIGLKREGLAVDWVRNSAEGEEAIASGEHALVLLDLGLPGKGGLELLRTTRRGGNHVPILVITARDELDDRILGLDLGADDYLVKPFALRELVARIRAVMRRQGGASHSILEADNLSLDLATHQLTSESASLVLPTREFALMCALMERPGAILSRAQLEERLYGWGHEVESNAVDVLIYALRKKFSKDVIRNVRGAGWMIPKGRP